MKIYNQTKIELKMNYVNFNSFQPLNETVYTREEVKAAILMVETKNSAKADKLVADLPETGNTTKSILSLVENKLDMVSALKSAKELLERNAFLGALAKAREAKSKTFEFNGKEYEVYGASDISEEEEQVEEKFRYTEDDINTIYGYYGTLETNFKKKDVERMYEEAVDGLIKAYKVSEKVAIAILDSKVGRHMADMIYAKMATDAVDALAKYFGSGARVWQYITGVVRLEESLDLSVKFDINEALKAKNPNEVVTIELDMAWDDEDKEEDKAAKAAFKKFKIKVVPAGHSNQQGTFEVTGKKKDILAYLQSEFYDMDDETIEEYYQELLEAKGSSQYGGPYGLSKAETKKVAETLAKAISKNDGVKCTVNTKSLEEDSFDLDIDGEEYDGGSYNIYDDGSVRNMAVSGEKYGTIKSTVEDFIKGLKNPVKESVITEASEIKVNKLSDIDHTRVIKWLADTFNNNDYEIRQKNSDDYIIIAKLGKSQEKEIKSYLKSQGYIKESTVTEGSKYALRDLPVVDWQRKQFDTLNAMYYAYLIDYAKSKGDKDADKKTVFQLADKYSGEIMSKLDVKSKDYADIAKALIKAGIIKESVVNEGLSAEQKMVETFLKKIAKEFDYSIQDAARFVKETITKMGLNESVTEAEDHEVAMAHNQLLDIAKNASELMTKIGETEKDLPGWVQDHISQAQNFISQANTGYYEVQESKIDEAQINDINAALKDIKEFNRGNIELEHLASSVIKNLGFKASQKNIDAVADHLRASAGGDDNIPEDKAVVKELYGILESKVNEGETLIFDEIGEDLVKLQNQIDSMLKWDITDQKWITALKGIQSASNKLEDLIAKADQKLGAINYNESKVNEGAVKAFEMDYKDMENSIKKGIGWIDPEYVEHTWDVSSDSIDFELVSDEIYRRLIKAGLLWTSKDGETKDKQIKSLKELGIKESIEIDEAKKYDLGFGSLGNGTTVWNRAKEVKGDYEIVAHISVGGNIKFYDKSMPEEVKKQIEDMAANESLEVNEKHEVTVSLRHAIQANDVFDDMYRRIGEKESTDVFSFKTANDAEDFIESLIMVGIPENEIN